MTTDELTPIITVLNALNPPNLDQQQYAHRAAPQRTATARHMPLSTHLDQKGTYVRMLFIDYSSAFNTIAPSRLVTTLLDLVLNSTLRTWMKDFLSNCPWTVRLGPHLPSGLSHRTGVKQGCMLSLLLYSLYTHNYTPSHHSNTIICKQHNSGGKYLTWGLNSLQKQRLQNDRMVHRQ